MTAPTGPAELPGLPEQFTAQIMAAVAAGPQVDALIAELALAPLANIFLVGCGGSLFAFSQIRCLLDRSPVPVMAFNSDELVLRRPALLGRGSLVIVSSTHGATRETAAAARHARAAGATVIGVTEDRTSVVDRHVELSGGTTSIDLGRAVPR